MPTLTRLLVVSACLLAAPLAAMADELPKDTNKIESLTVAEARTLAETFPGVDETVISKGSTTHFNDCLPLKRLRQLDDDVARALAGYEKGPLLLTGLTTLDADTAKALADFKSDLVLSGLTKLDAATAKALQQLGAESLDLSSLTSLDAATAKTLSGFKGRTLFLSGLSTLDSETAKELAGFEGKLCLTSLTTLDTDTAKAIGGHRGDALSLRGLRTLNPDTAKALAEFKGFALDLDGLTTLDADTAKALAGLNGKTLFLQRLTTLDGDTAKAFAEFRGKLYLARRVQESFFRKHPLSPETALVWVALSNGELHSITALDSPDSVAIAQALATAKGPLSLPNLKKISPKTLSALIEKEDIDIPPIETLELIPEPDGSPTDDFMIPQWLQERENRQRALQGR